MATAGDSARGGAVDRRTARRAAVLAVCAMAGANVAGAVLSFVYNIVVSPLPPGAGSRSDVLAKNLPWFVVDLVVSGAVLTALFAWLVLRAAATPDPALRARRVLALPVAMCTPVGVAWVLAAVSFAALNWDVGPDNLLACRTAVGISFAGAIATTLNYLLAERALRPLFRAVLADHPPRARRAGRIHNRLLAAWVVGSGFPLLWIGAALLDDSVAAPTTGALLYLVALALVGGAAVHSAVIHSVSDPIDETSAALRRVGRGDLDVHVPVEDRGELGELQAAVNAMTAGLRERDRIADLFGRFVSPEVAELALANGAAPHAERCEATVLFADVVGSTGLAEGREPEELLALLNDFFCAVVDAVQAEGGWVNGFDGDGAICVFGPPLGAADHAARGLRCARDLAVRIAALRQRHPALDAGIGVSTGCVVAGHVGAARRYEYTVVGAPANEAARLTDAAKQVPGRVLASRSAVAAARSEAARWQPAGTAAVRGAARAIEVYVPAGSAPAVAEAALAGGQAT